jgi:hypothetical protein
MDRFGCTAAFFVKIQHHALDIPRAHEVFYSPKSSRSEYHLAKAKYHCEAISLAERRIEPA